MIGGGARLNKCWNSWWHPLRFFHIRWSNYPYYSWFWQNLLSSLLTLNTVKFLVLWSPSSNQLHWDSWMRMDFIDKFARSPIDQPLYSLYHFWIRLNFCKYFTPLLQVFNLLFNINSFCNYYVRKKYTPITIFISIWYICFRSFVSHFQNFNIIIHLFPFLSFFSFHFFKKSLQIYNYILVWILNKHKFFFFSFLDCCNRHSFVN